MVSAAGVFQYSLVEFDNFPSDRSRLIEGPKLKGGNEGDNLVFSHSSNPDDDKPPYVVPMITSVSHMCFYDI
jgi:hypothetical protein